MLCRIGNSRKSICMDSPPCLQKRGRKLIDHPGQAVLCRTLSGKARFNETGETAPGCEMTAAPHRFVSLKASRSPDASVVRSAYLTTSCDDLLWTTSVFPNIARSRRSTTLACRWRQHSIRPGHSADATTPRRAYCILVVRCAIGSAAGPWKSSTRLPPAMGDGAVLELRRAATSSRTAAQIMSL
jgi:hypothetical protein